MRLYFDVRSADRWVKERVGRAIVDALVSALREGRAREWMHADDPSLRFILLSADDFGRDLAKVQALLSAFPRELVMRELGKEASELKRALRALEAKFRSLVKSLETYARNARLKSVKGVRGRLHLPARQVPEEVESIVREVGWLVSETKCSQVLPLYDLHRIWRDFLRKNCPVYEECRPWREVECPLLTWLKSSEGEELRRRLTDIAKMHSLDSRLCDMKREVREVIEELCRRDVPIEELLRLLGREERGWSKHPHIDYIGLDSRGRLWALELKTLVKAPAPHLTPRERRVLPAFRRLGFRTGLIIVRIGESVRRVVEGCGIIVELNET